MKFGKKLLPFAAVFASTALALAQGTVIGTTGTTPLQVGFVVITPAQPTNSLTAFETFGLTGAGGTTQAAVLSSTPSTSGILPLTFNGSLGRDLGIAVVNLNTMPAVMTFTLRDASGTRLATQSVTVQPMQQFSEFADQLFSSGTTTTVALVGLPSLTGTVEFTSNVPVAVLGLRFQGANFSSLPGVSTSQAFAVPQVANNPNIGGSGAFILPQFAAGAGWNTEIQVINLNPTTPETFRADFFDQNGNPMNVTLNGQTASSFQNLTVAPNGVSTLATIGANGQTPFGTDNPKQ